MDYSTLKYQTFVLPTSAFSRYPSVEIRSAVSSLARNGAPEYRTSLSFLTVAPFGAEIWGREGSLDEPRMATELLTSAMAGKQMLNSPLRTPERYRHFFASPS